MKKPLNLPDKYGHFGTYGGKFVPETLMVALEELEQSYKTFSKNTAFKKEIDTLLKNYAGRPTPLYYASNLSKKYQTNVFLKREDLAHTGAHKINNCIGQALLAHKMCKKRIIAETGAGQHGVATATVAALFNKKCRIYMGKEDIKRQAPNVMRMKLLGSEVYEVISSSQTLKDAMNEAIRDWVTNVKDTHYLIGSVAGPHPYPMIVRDFQKIIGLETKKQLNGSSPDYIIACVGGGSNAIGIFYPFLKTKTKLIGVEAGGLGLASGKHGAPLATGKIGVLHGSKSYVLQDKFGQIKEAHSISAGLDYPGVGPEHSYLKDLGLVKYVTVSDREAVKAFNILSNEEGILPALESAHALAYLEKIKLKKKQIIVINLSGRGDKDLQIVTDFIQRQSSK